MFLASRHQNRRRFFRAKSTFSVVSENGALAYIGIKAEALAMSPVPAGTCVMNIRGGEYKRRARLRLAPRLLGRWDARYEGEVAGVDRFIIVTDDPPYAKALFPGIPVLEGGIAECYMALYFADFLILSNSSFAYFPTKTSTIKRCVIAPKYWARYGNQYSRWASPANLYRELVMAGPCRAAVVIRGLFGRADCH